MEEPSNPLIEGKVGDADNDGFSLIDGAAPEDLLVSISDASLVDDKVNILDGADMLQKPEANLPTKKGKYNLRKSLAWDSAFFTSAGVLDAEELSCMIEGSNVGGQQMQHLPGIQEDVTKSTDSFSTLESDNLTLESLEADLFCDIRASIQRSGKASKLRTPAFNEGPEEAGSESQPGSGTKNIELQCGNMVKLESASTKINSSLKGDKKLMKLGPASEQGRKPVDRRRDPRSSLPKLPAASGKGRLMATVPAKAPTKRMSIAAGRNNVGNAMGCGSAASKFPRSGDSCSINPKAAPTASGSSITTRTKASSTRSSCDSTGSSSRSSQILPRNGLQGKTDRTVSVAPPVSKSRIPSRVPLKGKIQARRISAHSSTPKLSPSVSPTSSISEWSSSSSTATVNQVNILSKDCSNLHGRVSLESNASQDFEAHSVEQTSHEHENEVAGVPNVSAYKLLAGNGSLPNSVSGKPSGLRMPSPKIGFFDGVKAGGRTSKTVGGKQSRVPRSTTGSSSPSGASKKGRIGHAAVRATEVAAGNSKPDTESSNARMTATGGLEVQATALEKVSNGKNSEHFSTATSLNINGEHNYASAQLLNGRKHLSESGSSSRKENSLKNNASPEGVSHLQGNQISSVAEAVHHPVEICDNSKMPSTHLLHDVINGDTVNTENHLVSVSQEMGNALNVDHENAVAAIVSGGSEATSEKHDLTSVQNVCAEQQVNGLNAHMETAGDKRELCDEMNINSEPQSNVEFVSDSHLPAPLCAVEFPGFNRKEEASDFPGFNQNAVAVLVSAGSGATGEKHDSTSGQNVCAEQQVNRLSAHVETGGDKREFCEGMNENAEPQSNVNIVSGSHFPLLSCAVEFPGFNQKEEAVLPGFNQNAVTENVSGGSVATSQKHNSTPVQNLCAEQQVNRLSAQIETMRNKRELCEEMNENSEPQSNVNNFVSDSHLAALSCAVELPGFNQKEAAADLPKRPDLSVSSRTPASNPGSRTPLVDKNSFPDAHAMEVLVKSFTSLSLDSVQTENC